MSMNILVKKTFDNKELQDLLRFNGLYTVRTSTINNIDQICINWDNDRFMLSDTNTIHEDVKTHHLIVNTYNKNQRLETDTPTEKQIFDLINDTLREITNKTVIADHFKSYLLSCLNDYYFTPDIDFSGHDRQVVVDILNKYGLERFFKYYSNVFLHVKFYNDDLGQDKRTELLKHYLLIELGKDNETFDDMVERLIKTINAQYLTILDTI
jgi:hypothetical protein